MKKNFKIDYTIKNNPSSNLSLKTLWAHEKKADPKNNNEIKTIKNKKNK